MKSYKHLTEKLMDAELIKLAIRKTARGKRKRPYVRKVSDNPEDYVEYYRRYVISYLPVDREPKVIYDGIQKKKRKIYRPTFDEQVMHTMVVEVLKPIIMTELYPHVHGSIPEHGAQINRKQIVKWIKKKKCKYYFKCDIKKFFEMVNKKLLKGFLYFKIKDISFRIIIEKILDCVENGLPLGFNTSHWLAHWYIASIDWKVINRFHPKAYTRYVDDIVVFDNSKKRLRIIRRYLEGLFIMKSLVMKGNYRIVKFNDRNFLDFMGYRFYLNRVTLRKSIMIRISRKAKTLTKKPLNIYYARSMASSIGPLKDTNTYNMYKDRIKPFVNFGKIKHYISEFDRRANVCGAA